MKAHEKDPPVAVVEAVDGVLIGLNGVRFPPKILMIKVGIV
jgi:hypothetical protein